MNYMSNTNSAALAAHLASETAATQRIVDGFNRVQSPFTVVSAYLRFPDKNPSVFIQKLETLFETKILVSRRPKTILKQLNQAWDKCVKENPKMPFNPSALHMFLKSIHHLPELWNAELTLGTAPQTSPAPPAGPLYDG
jgi:hypothetical protein